MTSAPQPSDHDKRVNIIVNGSKKQVDGPTVSYEQIVNIAFDNKPPTGENVVITVTYSRGEHDAQGTLLPGKSVAVKSGMVFNAKATDRS